MQEKRRCHRIGIELPASYQASQAFRSISIATTLDISATGLCLLTREPLLVGQEIALQITLPVEGRIIVNVRVIWVKEIYTAMTTEFQIGLQIIEPMRADERAFVRFYAKQLRISRPPRPE